MFSLPGAIRSTSSASSHGLNRTCAAILPVGPKILGRSKRTVRPSRDEARSASHRRFSSVARNSQAVAFSDPVTRVAQNEPFERTGLSPKALKSSSKPDYLLDSKYRSHPLPRFEDESASQALSLRLQNNTLYLYDETEGQSKPIPGIWLRDHCACKQCRNQDTAQRQINVFKDNLSFDVAKYELSEGATQSLTVTFGDGHQSTFPAELILQRRSPRMTRSRYGLTPVTLWNADVASNPPMVSYKDFQDGPGMGALLRKIREYGFCFLDGMPATPEASEAALAAIGPIRNTHYGGFYDFTADLASKDTAYTTESLEPHNDNTYFTEAAGLQALHLLSHTHGSGGRSTLVDGFAAATALYVEDKHAYLRLAQTGIYAHASGNAGISLQPATAEPVLKHDPEGGFLTQVRWNNADRAGVAAESWEELAAWYAAAKRFDALLADPKACYEFQMQPGRMLIFDNWRALHGRTAFDGKRRVCGGYINRDDFISRYRQTNLTPEEIALSTVSG